MPSTMGQVVRELVELGINQGDPAVVERSYARNCITYAITSGIAERHGVNAEIDWMQQMRQVFPDLHVDIEEVVVSGDRAVTRWVARGTQRGEWQGILPSGRQVSWGGITIQRFIGGRIQEEWISADLLAVMRGIGGMQAARSVGERR